MDDPRPFLRTGNRIGARNPPKANHSHQGTPQSQGSSGSGPPHFSRFRVLLPEGLPSLDFFSGLSNSHRGIRPQSLLATFGRGGLAQASQSPRSQQFATPMDKELGIGPKKPFNRRNPPIFQDASRQKPNLPPFPGSLEGSGKNPLHLSLTRPALTEPRREEAKTLPLPHTRPFLQHTPNRTPLFASHLASATA